MKSTDQSRLSKRNIQVEPIGDQAKLLAALSKHYLPEHLPDLFM